MIGHLFLFGYGQNPLFEIRLKKQKILFAATRVASENGSGFRKTND